MVAISMRRKAIENTMTKDAQTLQGHVLNLNNTVELAILKPSIAKALDRKS